MTIVIVGAGAAGVFCAAHLRKKLPSAKVIVLEAGRKPLAKVAITGGGRCNLTNSFEGVDDLSKVYPRGANLMKRALRVFGHEDTWKWFRSRGVQLVLQPDHRVFPKFGDAMEIVHTLLDAAAGCEIRTGCKVVAIEATPSNGGPLTSGYKVVIAGGEIVHADAVVVTTGGGAVSMLSGLDIEIVPPVPSLFSFSINDSITKCSGASAEVSVSLRGTKFKSSGPLLITDFGMSGPAILKLSSYAARYLADNKYKATMAINWIGSEAMAREILNELAAANPAKKVSNVHPEAIPSRLWDYLIAKSGISSETRWRELGKGFNRLVDRLINDEYQIAGKTPFKDEFVTCGGVSLSEINMNTMESRKYPGLYFAGEVLDIDAITGGFNLQAAWSTAHLAASALATTATSTLAVKP